MKELWNIELHEFEMNLEMCVCVHVCAYNFQKHRASGTESWSSVL